MQKYAVQFIFVVCIASVIRAQFPETNICTNVEEGRSVPDFTDCSSFYRCVRGQPIHATCLGNRNFDRITEQCVFFASNRCFRCPANITFIDIAVDNNCIQFVRCFEDTPRQQTCGHGLLFDPVHRQCNFERNVNCACPTQVITGRPVMIRDPRNCAAFRVCLAELELHQECQPGLYFSNSLKQCDLPDRVHCPPSFL